MAETFGNHNSHSTSHCGLAECQLVGWGVETVGRQSQPTIGEILGPRFSERFWANVRKTSASACWLWTAGVDKDGYGQIARPGKSPIKAHRAAWMLKYGPITSTQHVLHHCDNPPCVNTAHLFLGDQAANMRDAAAKGRLSGNPHGKARVLSAEAEQELLSIYRQFPNRRLPNGMRDRLAERYGVHPAYVSMIGRGLRVRASV